MFKVAPGRTAALLALAGWLPRALAQSPQAPLTSLRSAELGPSLLSPRGPVDLRPIEVVVDGQPIDGVSRAAVLALIERGSLSEADVREMARERTLSGLAPRVRETYLAALRAQPDADPNTRSLLVLLNPQLPKLAPAAQLQAIAYVQRGVTPRVSELMGLQAFAGLDGLEQEFLIDRFAQLSSDIVTRISAETLIDSWKQTKAAEVLAEMEQLIRREPVRHLTLMPYSIDLQKLPAEPYTLGAVEHVAVGNYQFQSIQIDGRKVLLQMPRDARADPGLHLPSVLQIAEAFARLAPGTRNEIDSIVLRPGACPLNAERARRFRIKDFETAASVDLSLRGRELRSIDVWATREAPTTEDVVEHLTHEGKHLWFERAPEALKKAWVTDQMSDLVSDSLYATVALPEDVAKTATRRELMRRQGLKPAGLPARFKEIDKIEAQDPGPVRETAVAGPVS